ncbi:MAG: PilZ domain-containing protein [Planctomycetaceae bacterium]|nr:PilZ domain-containing protein [Planctomycetaceae bacterium]
MSAQVLSPAPNSSPLNVPAAPHAWNSAAAVDDNLVDGVITRALRRLHGTDSDWAASHDGTPPAEFRTDVPSAEKRVFPRRNVSGDIPFRCVSVELAAAVAALQDTLHLAPSHGELIDVSQSGIAFLTTQPVEPGHTILVTLPGSGPEPLFVAATIVRQFPIAEGQRKVVCRFNSPIPFESAYRLGSGNDVDPASVDVSIPPAAVWPFERLD